MGALGDDELASNAVAHIETPGPFIPKDRIVGVEGGARVGRGRLVHVLLE